MTAATTTTRPIGENLRRAEIEGLLKLSAPGAIESLFGRARNVRDRHIGPFVYLRGIIELSNICAKDCRYCGIRKSNRDLERFLIPEDEIAAAARNARNNGFTSILLQAGECRDHEFVQLVERLIRRIKEESGGETGITLSLGEQRREVYRRWFAAGAHRYLLRIETSNPKIYRSIHPGDHLHSVRKKCLEYLREIGYQVGSGILIGFPGQTAADLAADACFLKEIDVDMIGMGPYIPHPATPMGRETAVASPAARLETGLKMIAVCRLLMPDINIAATTALQTLDDRGWARGIRSGANVVMTDFTPRRYRSAYDLYQGRFTSDPAVPPLRQLEELLNGIPEKIIPGAWGDAPHFFTRTLPGGFYQRRAAGIR